MYKNQSTAVASKKSVMRTLPKLLLIYSLFWVPIVIIITLASAVRSNKPLLGEVNILNHIHTLSTPVLNKVFTIITTLGSAPIVIIVIVVMCAVLLYKKRRNQALFLLVAAGGTTVINVILKLLFHRTRPSLWHHIVVENDYSFPSGHAMISCALALSVIVLCWRFRYRWLIVVVAGLYVMLVGFSRLYLGVHYPSDVIAGWLISALWIAFLQKYIFRINYRQRLTGLASSNETTTDKINN